MSDDQVPGVVEVRGIGSMLPAGVRRRVRDRIMPWLGKGVHRVPSVTGKHVPLSPLEDSFVLPPIDRSLGDAPDGMPIPPKNLWHGYAETPERFLEIGRHNVETMRRVLSEHGRDIEPGDKILDFGCGAGPMTRVLHDFAERGEVWGVDLSEPHVWWCRRGLGAPFKFATSSTAAHLSFGDGRFDLAYCGSVFSHIPHHADAWLCELARVLRPGGVLYATFVPIEAMQRYLDEWPDLGFSAMLRDAFDEQTLRDAEFDVLVCGRRHDAHVVYREEMFLDMCRQEFDVVRVVPNVYSFQSAAVLVKRG